MPARTLYVCDSPDEKETLQHSQYKSSPKPTTYYPQHHRCYT